jgi:hypothetical protein
MIAVGVSHDGSAATGTSKPCTTSATVTFGEGASQTRTGSGPQVMATLRNLTVAIMKMAGHHNIAATTRHHARDDTRTRCRSKLGYGPVTCGFSEVRRHGCID